MQVAQASVAQELSDVVAQAFGSDRGLVCFANDFNGDPTSKHHIMRTYAAETPVVWVEASGMRRPQLRQAHDLRRIAGRLRRSVNTAGRAAGNLQVISPLSIPLPGNGLANAVNARIYRAAVKRALEAQHRTARPPLVWVYNPVVAPYLDSIPHSGVVYHCVDRWWEFSEYDTTVMRACHEDLCGRAQVVFASSSELLNDCLPHNSNSHLIPHGVQWEHFAAAAHGDLQVPSDVADIQGPVLGFFGLIHDWVDQDLLCSIARALPDTTLVLIGNARVDVSRLQAMPNIRLLGQRRFSELPAYCVAFDVALIPFVFNDLTAAVNPIKLREYLSAGLPVVASALPDVVAIDDNPNLATARNSAEFVDRITRFLKTRHENRAARYEAAALLHEHSWTSRCVQMAELVAKAGA